VLDAVVEQVIGAVAGGVDVVQIREPDLDGRTYVRLARDIGAATARTQTRILVNDRVDVALAAGAHGVHLRESSIPVDIVRRLTGPARIVGRAVHARAGVERARGADYLLAGSVFETASKPGSPATLGLSGLRDIVEAAGDCAVWAVGGITPERASEVVRQGVRGVAAIGAFVPAERSRNLSASVETLARNWRFSLTA